MRKTLAILMAAVFAIAACTTGGGAPATGGASSPSAAAQSFAADRYEDQNKIFLGMPRTTSYLHRLLEKTNFYLASVEPDVVRNRRPQAGEADDYREVAYSQDRRVSLSRGRSAGSGRRAGLRGACCFSATVAGTVGGGSAAA